MSDNIVFDRIDQRIDMLRDRIKIVEHENIDLCIKLEALDKALKDTNEYCLMLEKDITALAGKLVRV